MPQVLWRKPLGSDALLIESGGGCPRIPRRVARPHSAPDSKVARRAGRHVYPCKVWIGIGNLMACRVKSVTHSGGAKVKASAYWRAVGEN